MQRRLAAVAEPVDRTEPVDRVDPVAAPPAETAPEEEAAAAEPSAADEASFLAGKAEAHELASVPTAPAAEPATRLPSLDEALTRVPAELREVMDDLFRAKFTTVRKLPDKLVLSDGAS